MVLSLVYLKKKKKALNFVNPFFVFLVSISFVSALTFIIVFCLLRLGLICPFFLLLVLCKVKFFEI